ncbi:hypothetical protein [Streptomyces sp. NPDC090798]|uniref:hypothetical protein n=1 Tax=Streptomyces sp. NPDC090798 TaxID=3365968 RepID=UPI0038141BCD
MSGRLDAYCNEGPLFTEYAALGYGAASQSYSYKSYKCSDLPTEIDFTASRPSGDAIDFQVGGTSGPLNTWNYSATSRYDIGD